MYLYIRYENYLTLNNVQFFRDCSTDPFWDIINQWLIMAKISDWYIKTCKWSANGNDASLKLEKLNNIVGRGGG